MEGKLESLNCHSVKVLNKIRERMVKTFPEDEKPYGEICVYACGSLGRLELTEHSDLDLFFISLHKGEKDPMDIKLNQYRFFSKMYDINQEMGFSEPSKGGAYWTFIKKDCLLDIGSRSEDYNNSFTARLLLLLESRLIYNESGYNLLVKETIGRYFRDFEEHKNTFYPLFLMNDILRYWYTLTLNYEYRRDMNDSQEKRNWKRLRLKYARLATCFSFLGCLYRKGIDSEYVAECVKMTPFERFDFIARNQNSDVGDTVMKIREEYTKYLALREQGENFCCDDLRRKAFKDADRFHGLVAHNLMKKLAENCPKLKDKADFY